MSQPGRPSLGARKRALQISAYVTPPEVEALDRLCAQLGGVSRSDALREALHMATGVAVSIEVA